MIDWEHWIFEVLAIAHTLLLLVLVAYILTRQKNYGVAIAWIAILALMPFLGVVLYLIFGRAYISRHYGQRNKKAQNLLSDFAKRQDINLGSDEHLAKLNDDWQALAKMGEANTGFGVQGNHTATLLATPDAIFDAILADIHTAKKSIMLSFYIIHPQGRVLEIIDALLSAQARGVACVVLADSVGSGGFFRSKSYKSLINQGIRVEELLPVGLFKTVVARADVRNHRKIICIDEDIGYTGSFNLVDPRFFKAKSGVGQWIDVMIRTTHKHDVGVIKAMLTTIATDLSAQTSDNLSNLKQVIGTYTKKFPLPKNRLTNTRQPIDNKHQFHFDSVHNVVMQFLPSAPELSGHLVYETIISAIYNAKKSIIITTPYFVPDEPLMLALTSSARRGVDITLIMPTVNDSKLVKYASQANFQPLLEAGIRLALYREGLLHSKILLIDDVYALFGTVNMDMRSFYLNMEVTLAIYRTDDGFGLIDEIAQLQQQYLSHCDFISMSDWQNRKLYQQVRDGAVRLISPLL
ncbi:MAG: phospholipase D-like domain-containing protein [Moraxella sp.]|nr:phospholipase D-like domain-containing protein [Moraxella sp.]